MPKFPSPVLIFGDQYVSKSQVIGLRKKYPDFKWVSISATKSTPNEIAAEAGMTSFVDNEKVLVVEELPNRKEVREFLLHFGEHCPSHARLVVWDSTGQIKRDEKTGQILKTWTPFVEGFNKIKGSKIIDNGAALNGKNTGIGAKLVEELFAKHGKNIDSTAAELFVSIVGNNRGLIISEVNKMLPLCHDHIDLQFVMNHAFPTTKEAILYKLSNDLDTGSYETAIRSIEEFVEMGVNPNVIAEMILRKARWNLVAAHYIEQGLSPHGAASGIMGMGKFPSSIWHDERKDSITKKKQASVLKTVEDMQKYMVQCQGLLQRHFKKTDKKPKGEKMPMDFMAQNTTKFVSTHCTSHVHNHEKLSHYLMEVYLECYKRLVMIRRNQQPMQDLGFMAAALTGAGNEMS